MKMMMMMMMTTIMMTFFEVKVFALPPKGVDNKVFQVHFFVLHDDCDLPSGRWLQASPLSAVAS